MYLFVALALAASAFVVAGALRWVQYHVLDPQRFVYEADGGGDPSAAFELVLADGWTVAQQGELFPGDFVDPMLSYQRVVLVATKNLSVDCPTSSRGPVPDPVPSGDEPVIIPRATRDPGLDCILGAALDHGAGRLSVAIGTRSWGVVADDGPAIVDLGEPNADNGWSLDVDGRPARTSSDEEIGEGVVSESHVWDVLLPGQIDRVLRVIAEFRGDTPERADLLRDVEDIVGAIRFASTTPPLDPTTAADRLRVTVDDLDASLQEQGLDFAACMPREAGSSPGAISSGTYERLLEPVDVTCESRIEPSAAGLWRITLTATWQRTDEYPAGGLMYSLFVDGDGRLVVGYPQPANGGWFGPEGERPYLPLPRSGGGALQS